jgi:hypothetical protein
MAELTVTDVLSEIGLSAASARHLMRDLAVIDNLDLLPIEALVSKIGLLVNAGMGMLDPAHNDGTELAITQEWFIGNRGE